MKRKIENTIICITSIFGLIFRRIFGNKITFPIVTMVSLGSTIKTYNGRILIGKRTAIRKNTEVKVTDGHIDIGNKCFINRNCMIIAHESITIGEGTTIGPNVCIYDHDHAVNGYSCSPITIGNHVWIGSNSVILKGVSIGDNSVVGGGSIITRNIPENTIVIQKREDTLYKKLQ